MRPCQGRDGGSIPLARSKFVLSRRGGMVYTTDLKSVGRKPVSVRLRPAAIYKSRLMGDFLIPHLGSLILSLERFHRIAVFKQAIF
jgi:hypothetical protein